MFLLLIIILLVPFVAEANDCSSATAPLPMVHLMAGRVTQHSVTLGGGGSPSPDASSYLIARDGVQIASIPVNAGGFSDNGLEPDTTYIYTVSVKSACDKISSPVALAVKTLSSQPTPAPLPLNCPTYSSSSLDTASYSSTLWQVNQDEWNAAGVTHTQTLNYNTDLFPNCTSFSWNYPAGWNQVYAYPMVKYLLPATPVSVRDIENFTANYDISIKGDTDLMHVAWDIWMANSSLSKNGTVELMIGVHEPISPIGSNQPYTLRTISLSDANVLVYNGWGASSTDPGWLYIDVQPTTDMLVGSMDILDIFRALFAKGVLTGTETIAVGDIQFGTEIIGGSGSYTVNHFDYNFAVLPGVATFVPLSGTVVNKQPAGIASSASTMLPAKGSKSPQHPYPLGLLRAD